MKKLLSISILAIFSACAGKEIRHIDSEVEVIDSILSKKEEKLISEPKDIVLIPQKEEIEKPSSKNVLENFSFQSDTLVMDPGNTIVNLSYGLSRSGLSSNKNILRVLNPTKLMLFSFDLVQRKLINVIEFNKEGPNGVGEMVRYFQDLGEDTFFMASINQLGTYNLDGKKLRRIDIPEGSIEGLDQDLESITLNSLKIDENQGKLYFLHSDRENEKVSLVIFDIDTSKGFLLDLSKFGSLTKLDLLFKEGISTSISNTASLGLMMEKERAIIYSAGTSSLYVYNFSTRSLSWSSPNHKLVPNDQVPPPMNEFTTIEAFEEAFLATIFQISYSGLWYDDQRQMYFRFGSILEKSEVLDPWPDSEVFLFAYDKNLMLIGEARIKGLTKIPEYPFFKDGKLWSYVNVEDELGFAVMDFKF